MAVQTVTPRLAHTSDAAPCAQILNAWIDDTDWMPRIYSHAAVCAFYKDVMWRTRKVWVIGNQPQGFLAFDAATRLVTALYVATPGQGLGRALLDHVKALHPKLSLWTFQANTGARRFYGRAGFREIRFTDGENEEKLPDVLLRWERLG